MNEPDFFFPKDETEVAACEEEFWTFAEFAPKEVSQQIIVARFCDLVSQRFQVSTVGLSWTLVLTLCRT